VNASPAPTAPRRKVRLDKVTTNPRRVRASQGALLLPLVKTLKRPRDGTGSPASRTAKRTRRRRRETGAAAEGVNPYRCKTARRARVLPVRVTPRRPRPGLPGGSKPLKPKPFRAADPFARIGRGQAAGPRAAALRRPNGRRGSGPEEGSRTSGRMKALKAESQERHQGETNLDGRGGRKPSRGCETLKTERAGQEKPG
jgi:hypothetical protein